MKALLAALCLTLTASSANAAQPGTAQPPTAPPADRPRIELVFALDTTSSMAGLIEAAKTKIWSIVNQIASGKPAPDVRVGLVAYRDRGDAYITQVTELTGDLDAMYAKLMALRAEGGGDGPESVNQALHDAVNKMAWSQGGKVMRLVYLVGDWPPHMDYQDDVKYPETAKAAVARGIYINTIRCGTHADTERVWKDIALKAEGKYFSIAQEGGAVAVATPYDAEIARLDGEVRASAVLYGSAGARADAKAKAAAVDATMAAAPAEAKAERAVYAARKAKEAPAAPAGIAMGGAGGGAALDLVSAYEASPGDLAKVNESALPEEMRKMSPEQRKAYLDKKVAERKAAQAKLDELNKKRAAHLAEETKRAPARAKSLDSEVFESVRESASKIGVAY